MLNQERSTVGRGLSLDVVVKRLAGMMVLLLPFQKFPETLLYGGEEKVNIPSYIAAVRYLDEIAFLLFSVILASFVLVKPERFKLQGYPFLKWIVSFTVLCCVAMVVNKVYVIQGLFEIYNYIKNIIVVMLFAWMRATENDFRKLLSYIVMVGVIIAAGGVLGEMYALVFDRGIGVLVDHRQRLGLYRVMSLCGNGSWNYVGLYGTLVFYLAYARRTTRYDTVKLWLLATLVFLTLSRQAWLGFSMLFVMIVQVRNTVKPLLITGAVIVLIMATPFYGRIMDALNISSTLLDEEQYFRTFALSQSMDLFKESPAWGIGPGMFGGISSLRYGSSAYDSWPVYFHKFAYKIQGLDQFWPGLLADTGSFATLAYVLIFVSLARYLRKTVKYYKNENNSEMAGIGSVLYSFMIAMMIMGFAGGINVAFVTFTYFSLVGIYVSLYVKAKSAMNHEQ